MFSGRCSILGRLTALSVSPGARRLRFSRMEPPRRRRWPCFPRIVPLRSMTSRWSGSARNEAPAPRWHEASGQEQSLREKAEDENSTGRRGQSQVVDSFQDRFRPGANDGGWSEVPPANDAVRVEQKLRWPGNVRASRAGLRVEQIIAADHLCIRVGQEGIGVAVPAAELATELRGIDTDGDKLHTAGIEIFPAFLNTPQLGVAQRSPVAAVENQDDTVRLG